MDNLDARVRDNQREDERYERDLETHGKRVGRNMRDRDTIRGMISYEYNPTMEVRGYVESAGYSKSE
jgi:hypothetical protein